MFLLFDDTTVHVSEEDRDLGFISAAVGSGNWVANLREYGAYFNIRPPDIWEAFNALADTLPYLTKREEG